jgi:hypothetical protein
MSLSPADVQRTVAHLKAFFDTREKVAILLTVAYNDVCTRRIPTSHVSAAS